MTARAALAATAPAARPCGSLAVELAGEAALLRPSGALWIASARALVVADLHLEKGSFYAARGQLLPPYDTGETLKRLAAEALALGPDRIVLLGDSFHDLGGEGRLGEADLERVEALARGRTLTWITGNHDPAAPLRLPGETAASLSLGALTLTHEPAPGAARGEVAGHLHPCARVRARGASVRRRCFVTDGDRLVLPAFGALAGGLNIRDVAFAPLFPRRPLAGVLGAGRVHAVGWASLRDD